MTPETSLKLTLSSGTATNSITLASGAFLPAGALAAGQLVILSFDGTNWQVSESLVSAFVSVEQYGAIGDNATPDQIAIGNADAAGALVFSSGKTYYITSSPTFTSQAIFAPGASIRVASGQTVKFNMAPQAGPYQIFSGNVVVNDVVQAEWYGAKGDGSTNDATAITTALNSSQGVKLLAKTYFLGTSTIKPNVPTSGGISFVGSGVNLTLLTVNQDNTSNQDIIYLEAFNSTSVQAFWEIGAFTVQNLIKFTSSTQLPSGGDAIRVNYSANGYLHDLNIVNCWGGIAFTTVDDSVIERIFVNSCIDHSLKFSDVQGANPATIGVTGVSVSNFIAFGGPIGPIIIPPSQTPTTIYCKYGLYVNVFGNLGNISYNEGCQFYYCLFENHDQCIYVTGSGFVNWRTGHSGEFRFVSCYFDASIAGTNWLNCLRDSTFTNCYFGFSNFDGLTIIYTDGLEFSNCHVLFNFGNGVIIEDGTTNPRWIGGEIRNNSWLANHGVYSGLVIMPTVSNLLIQGVVFGDFPPQQTSPQMPLFYDSPSQKFGIVFSTDINSNFAGSNVIIMSCFLGIQVILPNVYGGFSMPSYPSHFTNSATVILLYNF